jgi:hypothetical protein
MQSCRSAVRALSCIYRGAGGQDATTVMTNVNPKSVVDELEVMINMAGLLDDTKNLNKYFSHEK